MHHIMPLPGFVSDYYEVREESMRSLSHANYAMLVKLQQGNERIHMELVILIGLQASGKSTFARTRFGETYRYVSKDLLKNNSNPARRQRQLIEEALQQGLSVVVDNTN